MAHQPGKLRKADYRFETGPRAYTILKVIGRGTYGTVYGAIPANESPETAQSAYAIKKVQSYGHQANILSILREVKLLRHFSHDNIISLVDTYASYGCGQILAVHLVMPCAEFTLAYVIHSRTVTLEENHRRLFTYQILRGLKAIHSAKVVHRDLKPSNILITKDCDVKICDFGLARIEGSHERGSSGMTEYVATRWYRAPEVLLKIPYNRSMDLWSVGCILAEMLLGRVLFKGSSALSMIAIMLEQWSFLGSWPDDAGDLIRLLLVVDPRLRIDVCEALKHPYVAQFHDPDDEPDAKMLDENEFGFEKHKEYLSTTAWQGNCMIMMRSTNIR